MTRMRKAVLLSAVISCLGCYDLKDGSIAVLFHWGDTDDQDRDTDSSFYETDTASNNGDTSSGSVDGDTQAEQNIWTVCDAAGESFAEMKTGDACSFAGSCGRGPLEGDIRQNRFAVCVNGIVSISESFKADEGVPREEMVWSDCGALGEARDGEACERDFNCFDEADNGCMEQVICELSDSSKIIRRYLCNDNGDYMTSSNVSYSDCAQIMDARPLDLCTDVFVCNGQVENSMAEIPSCEDNGYCVMQALLDWDYLVYCDGQNLHFFSNFSD
jgi:hypothetical protein